MADTRDRQLGMQVLVGLGAFAAGAAAWVIGTGRWGDRLADLAARAPGSAALARSGKPVDATGAVPGDSTTSPIVPRPADMAAAPVGMAETDKHFRERAGTVANEHVPTDLLADRAPASGDRAPDAFRPDPTAIPTDEEKEGLRPATGPAPTLVADRGSGFAEATGAS